MTELYTIKGETLTAIADAIRVQTGTEDQFDPVDMPGAITSIDNRPPLYDGSVGEVGEYVDVKKTSVSMKPKVALGYKQDGVWSETQHIAELALDGANIWTDGSNIYYSGSDGQYVLNDGAWEKKTWSLTGFLGSRIWTDGSNIYYSNQSKQYVLNGDTWEEKTWSGLTDFYGNDIWTDGTNVYYSRYSNQYVLNGDTWEPKTWSGLTSFTGDCIWTDGSNVYYSNLLDQYVLNGDTWEKKTWSGQTLFTGDRIWTDGSNIYYSSNASQYVLNGDAWETKTWFGMTKFQGDRIWTDGGNIYYSNGNSQYVLNGTVPYVYEVEPGEKIEFTVGGMRSDKDILVIAAPSGDDSEDWIIGDGNTHIWVTLNESNISPCVTVCLNGTVTVDWGDGSIPDVLTGKNINTPLSTPNHTYSSPGDYVITLAVDGEMDFYGSTTCGYTVCHSPDNSDSKNQRYYTAVRNVEIGSGVVGNKSYAFVNSRRLENVVFHPEMTAISSAMFSGCVMLRSVSAPGVTKIVNNAFSNCSALEKIYLPKRTTLHDSCFVSSGICEIIAPNGFEFAGNSVFSRAGQLFEIIIPDGITKIVNSAFSNCVALYRVIIPNSVTSIESAAFYDCKSVEYYDFSKHTSVPSLGGTNAFYNIASDCEIRVPAALVDEWKAATNWATYADYIVGV